MIIITLIASCLTLWLGYIWGEKNGRTELERKIVRHVVDSPEYGSHMVDAIRESLGAVKK